MTFDEKRVKEAIDRALASENARKKAIEDKIKAKIAHEKEMERRRIEREKARIARATPIPQRFFRFLGLLIAVTSSSAFP